ncbi:hypothetical protein MP638_006840 [Amoeboaphelidium occidentale]|nr:hypothetical protein MP638_006840 [Amoeboaphelidium occidentale]
MADKDEPKATNKHAKPENISYEIFASTTLHKILSDSGVEITSACGAPDLVNKKFTSSQDEWKGVFESMTSDDLYDKEAEFATMDQIEIDCLLYSCWSDKDVVFNDLSIQIVPGDQVLDNLEVPTYDSISPTATQNPELIGDTNCYIVGEITKGKKYSEKLGQLNKIVAALRKKKERDFRSNNTIAEDEELDVLSIIQYAILVVASAVDVLTVRKHFRNRKWIKRLCDAGRLLVVTIPSEDAGEMAASIANDTATSVSNSTIKRMIKNAQLRTEEAKRRTAELEELRAADERVRIQLQNSVDFFGNTLKQLGEQYEARMLHLSENDRIKRREEIKQAIILYEAKLSEARAKLTEFHEREIFDTKTEEKTSKAIQLLSDHKLLLPEERWSSKSTAEPSTSHTSKPITALEVMKLKKTEPITGKIAKGERVYCIFTDTRKCIVVNREWSLGKVFHVCGITHGQKLNDMPSESVNKQDTCNTILRNTGVLKDTILISE